MARETLLQMLEDLASKVRLLELEKRQATIEMQALEREKNEAVATAQALQHEVAELVNLITLAGEKVEEILKVGADDGVSQPQAVNALVESRSHEQLDEFSPDPHKQRKRLLPQSFISE